MSQNAKPPMVPYVKIAKYGYKEGAILTQMPRTQAIAEIIEWREAPIFYATLRFDRIFGNYIFIDDENEKRYEMFPTDFLNLMKDPDVDLFRPCSYRADWTFVKRGTAFGIKHIPRK